LQGSGKVSEAASPQAAAHPPTC